MYDRFRSCFVPDVEGERQGIVGPECGLLRDSSQLINFFDQVGAGTFNRGIYRTLDYAEVSPFHERLVGAFPSYRSRVCPFAVDWLNRMYCVDFKRQCAGQPLLLLFSLLSDEVLQIPFSIEEFHEQSLTKSSDELFERDLFLSFLKGNALQTLPRDKCASLKIPLYLGGEFEVENLEVADVEIDWNLNAELLRQTRPLLDGAVINNVELN